MDLCKDEGFRKAFNEAFPNGATKEELIDSYISFAEDNNISIDAQIAIGNVVKACFSSAIVDISDIQAKAVEHFLSLKDDISDELYKLFKTDISHKFLFLSFLVHAANAGNLDDILKMERDFISEVIADKFNVKAAEITQDMRLSVLEDNDTLYSIEDPPIEEWDSYFFNICRQVARNSKCLSRRIGAVLVNDKSIIGTGYNGPPRGVPRCDKRWSLDKKFIKHYQPQLKVPTTELENKCPRRCLGAKSGQLLDICVAAHAEENSILDAARRGTSAKGATMYMTCGIPCTKCLIKIIQVGIKEIVVTGIKFYDENAEWLLNNSNVKVRLYNL